MSNNSAQFSLDLFLCLLKRCVSIFCVCLALCASVCGQQRSVEERLSDVEKRVSALEKARENELAGYDLAKGTIRFPADKPLPVGLVKTRIAKYSA
jgi:hypothetical protein